MESHLKWIRLYLAGIGFCIAFISLIITGRWMTEGTLALPWIFPPFILVAIYLWFLFKEWWNRFK